MNVRAIRQAAGLSQIALSKCSGVKRARLQGAEAGYLELSNEEVAAITAAVCERPLLMSEEIRAAVAPATNRRASSAQERKNKLDAN